MNVKDTSFRKILEALFYDDKLKDFVLTINVGDAELAVKDISIDLKQEIVSITPGDRVVCDYAEDFEYDEEDGLLAGDYNE